MKFLNIRVIENVKNYQVCGENLIYCNSSLDLFFNDKLIAKNNESYFCFEDQVGYHLDNLTYFVDTNGEINNRFDVYFHPNNLFENSFTTSKKFFKNNKGNWESDLYLYQFNPIKEIKKYDNTIEGGLITLKIGFIQIDKLLIKFLERNTTQLLWQFDLSHLGTYKSSSNENKPYEVKKIIGVWQDYLIISLTNDELLIIKSKDGQFVNKLNKIPLQKMAEYTVDYLGSCMMLDQAEGKIKGFVNFVFWEFNLSNFTFECFNLAETIAQNNLSSLMNITSFAQSVTHYFVTMLKIDDTGSMTSYLVALNKQTKNFDWKYEIPWTGNNAPQYSGNKLYQLDNLHTLHIFQKT